MTLTRRQTLLAAALAARRGRPASRWRRATRGSGRRSSGRPTPR